MTTKRALIAGAMTAALTLLTGCAGKKFVDAYTVLQKPKGVELRTAHNIWFENPNAISSRNYHRGSILPLGAVVENIIVADDEITFTTAAGDDYTILFEKNYEMITIEDFLKRVFTTESPADLRMSMSSETFEEIKKGRVVVGMSKKEVVKSWGYPSAHRTPSLRLSTWIYWDAPQETIRVVFNGDAVSRVIRL